MSTPTVKEGTFKGKRVLVRVDFNVPVVDGTVEDPQRIEAARPTIDAIAEDGGKAILLTHFGRPENQDPSYSLRQILPAVKDVLGRDVLFIDDILDAGAAIERAPEGSVILAENLRFHPGEKKNDPAFAKALAEWGDCYVNEAFSVSHNADASVASLPAFFTERYAGLQLAQEIRLMEEALRRPKEGYVLIVGGAKLESKKPLMEHLYGRVEAILVGGKLAAEVKPREKMYLPTDTRDGKDIGPGTVARYLPMITRARTIVHAGPLGKIEEPPYDQGSVAVAHAVAMTEGFKLIGGGETGLLYAYAGVKDRVNASTGGGAMLAYLAGENLPGLDALERR